MLYLMHLVIMYSLQTNLDDKNNSRQSLFSDFLYSVIESLFDLNTLSLVLQNTHTHTHTYIYIYIYIYI